MLRPNPTVRRSEPTATWAPDLCCVCGEDGTVALSVAPPPRRLFRRRRDCRASICGDCQGKST